MISFARSLAANACVIRTQPLVSAYLMPTGGSVPLIGHQLKSALLPPIRTTGVWPGSRLRSNWMSTGST